MTHSLFLLSKQYFILIFNKIRIVGVGFGLIKFKYSIRSNKFNQIKYLSSLAKNPT